MHFETPTIKSLSQRREKRYNGLNRYRIVSMIFGIYLSKISYLIKFII